MVCGCELEVDCVFFEWFFEGVVAGGLAFVGDFYCFVDEFGVCECFV